MLRRLVLSVAIGLSSSWAVAAKVEDLIDQNAFNSFDSMIKEGERLAKMSMVEDECKHYIFVSRSISDEDIKSWLERANAAEGNIKIVLRGITEKRIVDSIRWIHKQVKEVRIRKGVQLFLDPRAFDDYLITSVPAQVFDCNGDTLKIYGAVSPGHLVEQYESGKRGEKNEGPTQPIVEKHLLEEMMSRASALNVDGQIKDKLNSFWSRHSVNNIPEAVEKTTHIANMQFQIPQDARVGSHVIGKKGDTVEMTQCVSFDVIAFDARKEDHVKWAMAQYVKTIESGRRPMIVSPGFWDWDQFNSIKQTFEQDVYQLTREFGYTFQILALPAHVTQVSKKEGCSFVVTQEPV